MSQTESRTKKTLLNARVNLIFYFLTLALSFFSRKIFLDCLGAEFVGLTGTLQNLLGFLNLAELGIGTAIGYLLYKPLYDHDQTKINEIISVMGYMYRWIGVVILGAGIILSLFLPLIFPDSNTEFELPLIYFAYFSFLISSLIGYFINYRQNLLGADQRNYVVTAYYQSIIIVKTLIQMASAYYTGSYYLWVIFELAFGIIYSFVLNWKINQTYPWLKAEIALGRNLLKKYPEVLIKTRQLFVHRISSFVQFQTTPFLIYSFANLTTVALYSNYSLVTDKVSGLFNNFLGATSAGVGNLIAEGNKSKIIRIFWELLMLQVFIGFFAVFMIYHLINPFITLWIGDKYLLSEIIVILVLIRTFIGQTRGTVDQFLYGYGLFSDTWAPVTEAVIFIFTAVVAGYFWGLPGVLLGGVLSLLIIVWMWKPIFLFSQGFKIPVSVYWIKLFKVYLLAFLVMYGCSVLIGTFNFVNPSEGGISFILYAVLLSAIFTVTYLFLFSVFFKEMKMLVADIFNKMVRRS